jgi:hypothetical protein
VNEVTLGLRVETKTFSTCQQRPRVGVTVHGNLTELLKSFPLQVGASRLCCIRYLKTSATLEYPGMLSGPGLMILDMLKAGSCDLFFCNGLL